MEELDGGWPRANLYSIQAAAAIFIIHYLNSLERHRLAVSFSHPCTLVPDYEAGAPC